MLEVVARTVHLAQEKRDHVMDMLQDESSKMQLHLLVGVSCTNKAPIFTVISNISQLPDGHKQKAKPAANTASICTLSRFTDMMRWNCWIC